MRHGRKEGRKSRFDNGDGYEVELAVEDKWKSIFSVAEFLAWCGHELDEIPNSREEALEVFLSKGVTRIWPINFKYAFDADFVRSNHLMPTHEEKSDVDLYRIWLAEGFVKGVPPNEEMFLAPYLGELSFPLAFDWQRFARKAGMPVGATRSQALMGLFKATTRDILENADLMGDDIGCLLRKIADRALARGDSRKAIGLLTKCAAILPSTETMSLLGQAYRSRGAMAKALAAYQQAIASDDVPMSTFFQMLDILALKGDYSQAFVVLRKAFPAWRHRVEFEAKLIEILQLYFDHRSAEAHALYRRSVAGTSDRTSRQAADDLLTETLDHIRDLYLEMDSLPAPIGGDANGYVAMLVNDDLAQCTHYRIEQKALAFEKAGIPVRIFPHSDVQGFSDSLVGARAAIFYRVGAVPKILRAILHANSMRLATFYEVDDLIFDSSCYPDPFASFEGQLSSVDYAGLQFGVPLFRYAMMTCGASIASTPTLAEKMASVTGHTAHVVRNGLDIRNDLAIQVGARPIRPEQGRVRIFYGSGTKAHNADFNRIVAPTLLTLMARHPQVDLVIVGHLKLQPDLAAMGARIIAFPFIEDLNTYWSLLASCNINLAVLEPGIVADCKSEIKWLEAAILQVPSIVSATKTYEEVIDQGVDGFIARSEKEWDELLESLITSSKLRAQVGAKARDKALRLYDIDRAAHALQLIFRSEGLFCVEVSPASTRILICNIFFAPQSYGGATRVVEDNVRIFSEDYPDLEIGVFCSQAGASPSGKLILSCEKGVPVYRLSVPQESAIEWQPFCDDHAEPFQRVLDHFKPDLVHFHCIQNLTATIVEVVDRRGIPYVVTLHDAWWISDHQFLVDRNGMLQNILSDALLDGKQNWARPISVARRQRLAALLQKSRANLSVSKPFSAVYRSAGISNVHVIENGVPSFKEVGRLPRPDGLVALGHIGGRSFHKGAALIEAALKRGNFKQLHLTLMDGTLASGQSVDTIWGSTPVTLVGPCSQAEIAQVYSRLDVLLAPSVWPESFGLVSREAMKCGLWIVASDQGAIGEGVRDGYNGHLVDVSTIRELTNVLSVINENPGKYQKMPPTHEIYRSTTEQAAELYKLYRSLMPK